MQKIGFYLIYPILLLVSLLPFKLLYLLSDFFYFLIYKVIGYRKQVVYYNLKRSFPDYQEREIFKIRKDFYHHLCDIFLESIKSATISKKQMLKRSKVVNENLLFEKYKDQSVIFMLGHYCNWEWAGQLASIHFDHKIHIIYHELSNPEFDRFFYKMRSKFGAHLSTMKNAFREMIRLKNQASATCLVADQNPSPHTAFWTKFLSQDTPFFRGPAKLGQKLDYPIFYISSEKNKRGYYTFEPKLVFENPKEVSEEMIIKKYTELLEADIKEQPAYWLWSHRRWKHKYEDYKSSS